MPVSKKKSRKIGAALIAVISVVLIIFAVVGLNFRSASLIVPLDSVFTDLSGYFQKGISNPVQWVTSVWDSYVNLRSVKQENKALQYEVARLRQEVVRYREALIENEQLRGLLRMSETAGGRNIVASIVGMDIDPWVSTVTVDKGRMDGVGRDMVVLAAEGVAGRIIKSGLHFSRVMLISDYNSAVGAMIQSSRTRGILKGNGRGRCTLEYVEKGLDVEAGDQVITSGTDGIFPKGLMLGKVSSVKNAGESTLFQSIEVDPAVDLQGLEKVLIIIAEKPLLEQEK